MYVLAHLEWIANEAGECCPTQLAALRVDAQWQAADAFASLIHPRSGSFQLWTHKAYTGAAREDFLHAKGAASVLKKFLSWLEPDDVVCWWHQEAMAHFAAFLRDALYQEAENRMVVLRKYFRCYVFDGKPVHGSPHSLAAVREISVPLPEHCAANCAEALRALLAGVSFPQDVLSSDAPNYQSVNALLPFQLDCSAQTLHRRGCPLIPEGVQTTGFAVLAEGLRSDPRICPHCLRKDMRALLRQRNTDWIARTQYHYVYTPGSGIFHTPECHHILRARRILGFNHYSACIRKGLNPCKVCQPRAGRGIEFPPPVPETDRAAARRSRQEPSMPEEQRRAVKRQRQARAERGQLSRMRLTAEERRDRTTLSQANLAFWGAKGFRTFHLRDCPKLERMTEIEGFSRYQDAIAAGYRPCRYCRPSRRDDLSLSVPISSRERTEDTVEAALEKCARYGIDCTYETPVLSLQTRTGRWRLNAAQRPITLEHINLIKTPRNRRHYHTQPKIFLSLADAVAYIIQHDLEAERAQAEEGAGRRRKSVSMPWRKGNGKRKRPPL